MMRMTLAVVCAIWSGIALVSPVAAQTVIGRGAGSSHGSGGLGALGAGPGSPGADALTPRNFDTSLKPSLEAGSPSTEELARAVRAAPQAVQVAPPAADEAAAAPDSGGAGCICQDGHPSDSAGLCWIDGQEQGWRQERCGQ